MVGINDLHQSILGYSKEAPSGFSPYADNGGTVVAVAGDNFVVIASDTRLSFGYSIHTRNQSKLFKLSDQTVLGCSGCWCDTLSLTLLLKARMQMYFHDNNKLMTTPAVAQMLATLLYYKRFFPYYVSNILAGLDSEGKGCIYSYDPVGHCELSKYRAGGSAGALLQPLLDNQLGYKNMVNVTPEPLTIEKAVNIIKDAFMGATERDIYTGDSVHINIITSEGTTEEIFPLRKD